MMRRIMMAVTTVAIVVTWSTMEASARGGMGGHGGTGGGMGHAMGGMGMGRAMGGGMGRAMGVGMVTHAAVFRPSGVGNFAVARPVNLGATRFAFPNRFAFRHHFFRNRFAFFGGVYPYGYYDDGCYSRALTPWGWRWQYVCY